MNRTDPAFLRGDAVNGLAPAHAATSVAAVAAPTSALPSAPPSSRSSARSSAYFRLLGMAFALFGTLRLVSYLPTLLAIHASGDSSQHSLWTWGIWLGSNFTMAVWLYEEDGRRMNRAIGLSLCNAAMCAAAVVLIVFYRVVSP